uniref:Uncharacterized protein LOC114335581 isoform X1 n=2 Tax=Diabrotica virgifera virgifera TaxID=50390 RepID=A0A6P7GB39_DIAVI
MTYEDKTLLYKIIEREDIHNLLDQEYFETYIMANGNSIEVVILKEELGEENDQFSWNPRTTNLLLSAYKERKALFRDPKVKKKGLWADIKNVFLNHGYFVSVDILDRKFRNLKCHFKNIKDKAKKTRSGKAKVSWEYFDTMSAIFDEDKTMNPDEVISSMNMALKRDVCDDEESILPTIPIYADDSQPSTGSSEAEDETEDLYKYRSVMLDLETRKVVALEKIAKALEDMTDIQKERNDLIQSYFESKIDKN